jgi:hypothetical protein
MTTLTALTTLARALVCLSGIFGAIGSVAAPASGSSQHSTAGTSRVRPLALADTDNFCAGVHLKTGWTIAFDMVALRTPATQQSTTLASTVAHATSYADIVSYVGFDYVLESSTYHTGSLRWSLWAVPRNQVVGWPAINGHRLGGFTPRLVDGLGQVRDYLYNLTEITFRERITTVNPPPGRYCLAAVVEMYRTDSECRTADRYCPEIVYVQTPAVTFR